MDILYVYLSVKIIFLKNMFILDVVLFFYFHCSLFLNYQVLLLSLLEISRLLVMNMSVIPCNMNACEECTIPLYNVLNLFHPVFISVIICTNRRTVAESGYVLITS